MEVKLEQTKGVFKLVGKVARIDTDYSFDEKIMNNESNRNHGRKYRSLRFGVKTSEENEITVSMFDYEPEEVFLWNSEKRKEDDRYKGDRVPYATWLQQQDSLREQGYAVLQSRIGLEYDSSGKLVTRGVPSYVASKEIYGALNNGDSVVVEGEIRYSRYTNRDGVEVKQTNYTIRRLFKIKDIDFFDEDFEERTYFEQEMVFVDADHDKKEGKVYVTGRTIDYLGNYEDTEFVVSYKDDGGNTDEDIEKLSSAFLKRFKFGDVINAFGNTYNRVIIEEDEDDELDEEAELIAMLGGKSKPDHAKAYVSRTYITEMQILGVDAWDKGVYSDDDFISNDNLIADSDSNDLTDELGGKKKKNSNPFTSSDDDEDLISDEDIPFL